METGHHAAGADLPGQEDLLLRITSGPADPAGPAWLLRLAEPGGRRAPDRRPGGGHGMYGCCARALLAPSKRFERFEWFEASWHPALLRGRCHPRWAMIDPM
jgi:hypothetical protein